MSAQYKTQNEKIIFIVKLMWLKKENMEGVKESLKAVEKDSLSKSGRENKEGKVAKIIENQTSKVPSDIYLWAATGSIVASMVLKIMKKNSMALFVGQWTAPFLILGLYNKLVKLEGNG